MVVNELELKTNPQPDQGPISAANVKKVLIRDETIVAAVQAAQRSYKQPPKKVSEETVENLSATIQAQRLAVYLAIKEGAKIKLEENKDKIAVAIFGMKEGGINDKFFEPLKQETVNIPTENDPIKGNIQQIADGENFVTVMAFYSAQNLKKAAAEKKVKPKTDDQADAADKTGDKKDRDKITAAECKATEEDAYISVVVKVPLLLAFFLLA
uniref:Variant surface glycoprotein n=1 Tax=Trypanosoma brucei TaxID=5691 RepID=A0A1V0FZE3_9TRYP|nr:variant surface glycoprotein [Trypanosoma brucei]